MQALQDENTGPCILASPRVPTQSGLRVEPENGEPDQPGLASGADSGSVEILSIGVEMESGGGPLGLIVPVTLPTA